MSFVSRWGPLLFWCAVIFGFSHIPDLNSGLSYDYPLRKLAHVVEYGILWFCARRAFQNPLAALLFSVIYAVFDEWHQSCVPGRAARVSDVAIDVLGALTALTGARFARPKT
jgi:VanZ family protein